MQSDLRKKLLEIFTSRQDEYVSGQELAEKLGVSRTAVWKHMEELRKDGFILEAVRKKGYRIVSSTEKLSENEIRYGLQTKWMGSVIEYKDTVDSTQKLAQNLLLDGTPEGTIVVAEEQLAGRGRLDRSWHSPKYKGVWMSVVLKPEIPIMKAPQLTLLTAVSVVTAIMNITNLQPHIKWPNDILINGKKVTGILTELQADADRIHALIIGIGINVNQTLEDYPEELRSIATSLQIETGTKINRVAFIQQILAELERLYELYLEKGFYPIKLLWESYAISIGKKVTANTLTGSIVGVATGITEDGVLLLQDDEGKVHTIYSADIALTD